MGAVRAAGAVPLPHGRELGQGPKRRESHEPGTSRWYRDGC